MLALLLSPKCMRLYAVLLFLDCLERVGWVGRVGQVEWIEANTTAWVMRRTEAIVMESIDSMKSIEYWEDKTLSAKTDGSFRKGLRSSIGCWS